MNLGKNLDYLCETGLCNQKLFLWDSEVYSESNLDMGCPFPSGSLVRHQHALIQLTFSPTSTYSRKPLSTEFVPFYDASLHLWYYITLRD